MSPVRRLTERERGGRLRSSGDAPVVCRVLGPAPTGWLNVGDIAVMAADFSDPSSTATPVDPVTGFKLVNPDTVSCVVLLPDGSETMIDASATGTTWSAQLAVTLSGTHWFRFIGSGTYQGVGQLFFQVRQQRA